MKKTIVTLLSACMLLTASSAAFAAVPVAEKKHEQKVEKKHEHKVHMKAAHEKKIKAKKHHKHESKIHAKGMKAKSLHAKSLKAKEISELPKTGFGGASEQTE
ncbi:hypothetical protein [Cohnella cholangitidis]|uniref:Acid shock protein n=1 Tax=Cohnella cholangitidis TaxID=2598458 RepID=A0A7G5C171_9BACL|nr:hypothetical protein [Cohnella cholangitidis]QMV42955.1 hypothetical protein FPL14_18505 [Cohnella cholangitidis]